MEQAASSLTPIMKGLTDPKFVPLSTGRRDSVKGQRRLTVFQDSTNIVAGGASQPLHMHPSPSTTLGNANGSTATPIPSISLPNRSHDVERRLRRYSLAEEALSSILRRCNTEASAQELQIRTLERATALLSAHAEEAKERAVKLKKALADRSIDPEEHTDLLKQRWLEEKRQVVVTEESQTVNKLLVSLRKSRSVDGPVSLSTSGSLTPLSPKAKRQANLAKFFELSRGQAPVFPHRPRSSIVDRAPRRMTSMDVSPFKLRTSFATVHDFTSYHARSLSVGTPSTSKGAQRSSRSPSTVSRVTSSEGHQTLEVVEEDCGGSEHQPEGELSPIPSPAATSTTYPTEVESLDCTTPASCGGSVPLPKVYDLEDGKHDGTAVIFTPPPVERSPEEILADIKEIKVSIPDYALELIDQFNISPSPGRVHFSLGTPTTPTRSSNSPTTPTPRTPRRTSFVQPHVSLDITSPAPTAENATQRSTTPVQSMPQARDPSSLRKATSRRQLHSILSISESISSCVGSEATSSKADLVSLSSTTSFVQVVPPTKEETSSPSSLAAKIKRRFAFKS